MLDKNERLLSKCQLKEWIQLDREACGYPSKATMKELLLGFIAPNYILKFERLLREVEYLSNSKTGCFWVGVLLFKRIKLRRLQLRLGITIPINVFGPGLSIAHYGTIVVSQNAKIGKNCRIHAGVNIGASGGKEEAPMIGDNCYIGPGAILFGGITIGDNCSIGANSTVNKSFGDNVVIAGTPAKVLKEHSLPWNSYIC